MVNGFYRLCSWHLSLIWRYTCSPCCSLSIGQYTWTLLYDVMWISRDLLPQSIRHIPFCSLVRKYSIGEGNNDASLELLIDYKNINKWHYRMKTLIYFINMELIAFWIMPENVLYLINFVFYRFVLKYILHVTLCIRIEYD